MAIARFREKKVDVFSMAAEKAEPTQVDSKPIPSLEPVKRSPATERQLISQHSQESLESSEDFYDAEEELTTVTTDTRDSHGPATDLPSDIVQEDESTDGDDIAGVVFANKSVILHILSQVKVGMDLTRFTLPAFLLTPRSMLQMYAGLFGRPNMITKITDQPTPKDRMIAVVKWFLASISAFRKDPAPKKPYNPVLGETFHCFWDPPQTRTSPANGEQVLAETGPFPGAGHDAFTFIAEQVSHHPPVSAVYGECVAKKTYISTTVCTKTRLTSSLTAPLSVKIQNTGKFRLCLLDHGEEYVTALPNGYARGVFTVPWVEFAGDCVVECEKTGHSAKITFHSKPFAGGRRHRVTADLRHKSDKKPYMTFEGEWDSIVYSKEENMEPEACIDATEPTCPMKMKSLATAEASDSRIVWKNLTEAILDNNDQIAGEAKHEVEERQREKARERERTGDKFVPKYFHQNEDDPTLWDYNNQLDTRLESL